MLVDFWTYSCINCLRAIPYVRAWAEKYNEQGLVVIGVHAPEFAFEKNVGNVRKAVSDLRIAYPVAIDNDYAIWRAFKNEYWPAHYFIDAKGQIRHHHFGEGDYDESERVIQQLLKEAGTATVKTELVSVHATGAEAAPDLEDALSPETYVGYGRAEHFVSPGGAVQDRRHSYTSGTPTTQRMGAVRRLDDRRGRRSSRGEGRPHRLPLSRARPASRARSHRGRQVRCGSGSPSTARLPGRVTEPTSTQRATASSPEQRLYQLIRQTGAVSDHTFEIRFLDPGVQVYAFTFG